MSGAVLEDLPQSVTIAGRKYTAAADHGVAVLLTAAGCSGCPARSSRNIAAS